MLAFCIGMAFAWTNAMADDSVDKTLSEEMIDARLADSFPASDPPSWTLGREKQPTRNRVETVVEPKDENMWG